MAVALSRAPERTELPTSAAWSSIGIDETGGFVSGGADVENAFHRMAAPKGFSEFFTLPTVRTKFLAGEVIADWPNDGWITPERQVLPMGWSWSAFFC